jgi:Fur family peroxide stress response transcriptional regulator
VGINKPTIQDRLEHFKAACREADLKLTHQRLEIFRELAEAMDHPTAETLYRRLKETLPTLSLDTVYRTLATFEEYNLVTRVQTTESHARFEARSGHHHAVCSRCGKITDFEWDDFGVASIIFRTFD